MKIKPKTVLVNLPNYCLFDTVDELPKFAANINTLLHGKQKVKYEEMGMHDGQYIGLFYIDRRDEYFELREFIQLYLADGEEARLLREQKEDESNYPEE